MKSQKLASFPLCSFAAVGVSVPSWFLIFLLPWSHIFSDLDCETLKSKAVGTFSKPLPTLNHTEGLENTVCIRNTAANPWGLEAEASLWKVCDCGNMTLNKIKSHILAMTASAGTAKPTTQGPRKGISASVNLLGSLYFWMLCFGFPC